MCRNSSGFKIMNTKEIIVECNCVCGAEAVLAIIENHLRVHAETDCIVNICVQSFLTLGQFLSESNALCGKSMKARSLLFCLKVHVRIGQTLRVIIEPMVLTGSEEGMLPREPRMIVPLHLELPPYFRDR